MKCTRCKKDKPPKAFRIRRDNKRGRQYYCYACMREIASARWKQRQKALVPGTGL
jgi:hypothetical protein